MYLELLRDDVDYAISCLQGDPDRPPERPRHVLQHVGWESDWDIHTGDCPDLKRRRLDVCLGLEAPFTWVVIPLRILLPHEAGRQLLDVLVKHRSMMDGSWSLKKYRLEWQERQAKGGGR
jgi:hypothetical protein